MHYLLESVWQPVLPLFFFFNFFFKRRLGILVSFFLSLSLCLTLSLYKEKAMNLGQLSLGKQDFIYTYI